MAVGNLSFVSFVSSVLLLFIIIVVVFVRCRVEDLLEECVLAIVLRVLSFWFLILYFTFEIVLLFNDVFFPCTM